MLIDTTLSAATLLDRALAIETAYGRERGEANAPRTLDVDLIVVGDRRANDENLKLPHPLAKERAFVLAPWLDLEPDAEIPDARSDRRPPREGRPRRHHPPRRHRARPAVSPDDPEKESPEGRIRLTPVPTLVGLGVLGLVAGWAVRPLSMRLDLTPPVVSWFAAALVGLVALIVAASAWATARLVRQRRADLPPHQAVNRLALGKASALAGALIAGGYFGYAVAHLGVTDTELAGEIMVRSALAGSGRPGASWAQAFCLSVRVVSDPMTTRP